MHKPMLLAATAMLAFGSMLVPLPGTALGADPANAPATLTDKERAAKIKALEVELASLQDPTVTKLKDLEKKYQEAWDKTEAALASQAAEMQKLRATDAYRQYQEKQRELYTRLHELRDVEQERLSRECAHLQAERQAELATLAAPALAAAGKLGFDVLSYPRLDGSTSTHPLAMLVTCRIFSVPCGWQTATERTYGAPRFEDASADFGSDTDPAVSSGPDLPGRGHRLMSVAFQAEDYGIATARFTARADNPAGTRLAQIVSSMLAVNAGTHDGYVNLAEGRCDLNLTVRPPSAEESKLAKDKGVAFTLTPVARDALVFMVNFRNPAIALTSDQIRGVYLGKVTSWKELGGDGNEIQAFRREKNSGSQELLEALLLGGKPLPERGRSIIAYSMMGPFNALVNNERGIGFSVWYYEHFMAASPRVKLLSVDGVAPTRETITNGKYPYVFPIYAALRQDAKPDSPAARLLAWLLSPEGQAVVRESGYVPLAPK